MVPVSIDLAQNRRLVIPDGELEWRFSPSGGPGGQHANRSSTRVELAWSIEDSAVVTDEQRRLLMAALGPVVRVVVGDHRSQLRNREGASLRLAERCGAALQQTKARKATKPSKGAKRRRLDTKRKTSRTKQLRQRPGKDD